MTLNLESTEQKGTGCEEWSQDETIRHRQHGQEQQQQQQRQQSVDSSESESLYEIQAVRSERQVHEQLRGTGDGMLTPQISRMSHNSLAHRISTRGTTGTTDPNFEVDWDDENDPQNPWNWSLPYTAMCIAFLSYNTLVMCVLLPARECLKSADFSLPIVSYFPPATPLALRKFPRNSGSRKQLSLWDSHSTSWAWRWAP